MFMTNVYYGTRQLGTCFLRRNSSFLRLSFFGKPRKGRTVYKLNCFLFHSVRGVYVPRGRQCATVIFFICRTNKVKLRHQLKSCASIQHNAEEHTGYTCASALSKSFMCFLFIIIFLTTNLVFAGLIALLLVVIKTYYWYLLVCAI